MAALPASEDFPRFDCAGPAAPPLSPDNNETWSLPAVEPSDGVDAMSQQQLRNALRGWFNVSQRLTAELIAARATLARPDQQLEHERREFNRVKAELTADLIEARKATNRAVERTEALYKMTSDPLLAPALSARKAPILLLDAIGRQFKIPFEKCRSHRVSNSPPPCILNPVNNIYHRTWVP